ncbi:MAG TPA: serine hydrolase domain-containing protein [Pyrinomonadaceae bacterium]|nr:serine hydrolase domain-containing protein [Pyrinomonadaceae bacterium]
MPYGLTPNPETNISTLLRSRIDAGDFPSAVYVVAQNGQMVFGDALGDAVREPEEHAATLETIYDLASLTKPLVTGMLCARMLERREIALDDPIKQYLPEFDVAGKETITLQHLVSHTSGFPAWRPLYLLAGDPRNAIRAIADQPLEHKPGERVIYSDLGFIVLGFLLQQLSGLSLPELARREIFDRLDLSRSFFLPSAAMRTGVAACETGNAYERDMCERDFSGHSYTGWRSGTIWGEVHDGNANFLGGAAGHAGLFSNAAETLVLANQFIGELSALLSSETCQLFRESLTNGLNEARSLAWQLAATKDSTAGERLPPDAFGHTGFTGTSCWIDASKARTFILLTNRTHARPLPFANINAVRREFHSLAADALDRQ